MNPSPYLSSGSRLADVLAAIQATATYKFYQLPVEGNGGWAYRITGDASKASEVKDVFEDHPEFFRKDRGGNWALVWRRQHQKLYDVDKNAEILRAEFDALTSEEKNRVSRSPLDPSEVTTLINAAIELHEAALAYQLSSRWWITPLVSLVSAFGGAVLGSLL